MYKRDNLYEVFMQEVSFKDLFTSNTMINYYLNPNIIIHGIFIG